MEDEAALDDLYVHSDAADGMGLLHISGTTRADGNLPLAVTVRCAKDGVEKPLRHCLCRTAHSLER